jgi:hypothetical protein
MHYNLLGGMAPDRTRVDVALAPPESTGSLIRLGSMGLVKRNLQIAADDAASIHTQSATVAQWRALRGQPPLPSGTGYVLGAGGHMHLIGRRLTITRTNGSGDTVLLDIPAWSTERRSPSLAPTPSRSAASTTTATSIGSPWVFHRTRRSAGVRARATRCASPRSRWSTGYRSNRSRLPDS